MRVSKADLAIQKAIGSKAETYIDTTMRVSQAVYIHLLTDGHSSYRFWIDAAFAIEGV